VQTSTPTVRAVDVGYGHIKFSNGRQRDTITTRALPSQSIAAHTPGVRIRGTLMQERDTVYVPVGKRFYEVGRDVHLAIGANQITEVLDNDFALSDHYSARLLGAINYMLPLPDNRIDVLILGLPLNTFARHKDELAKRFTGEIVININGTTVDIGSCHVYPQPLGSYMAFLATRPSEKKPKVLCIDPGYNTFDWFVCQGMAAISSLSGAVKRGMGAVIKEIADEMTRAHGFGGDSHELVRLIDQALVTNKPLQVYGHTYNLAEYVMAGHSVIEQAAQAVQDSIGDGKTISAIVITGGGATMYEPVIRAKFPHHEVYILEHPSHANVRGFHILGEMIAESFQRARNL